MGRPSRQEIAGQTETRIVLRTQTLGRMPALEHDRRGTRLLNSSSYVGSQLSRPFAAVGNTFSRGPCALGSATKNVGGREESGVHFSR